VNRILYNIWFGARLALLLLALAVLSFGHRHLVRLGLPPAASDNSEVAANAAPGLAKPDQPDRQSATEYYGANRASIVLSAAAMPLLPPAVVLLDMGGPVWPVEMPVRSVAPKFVASFQARAPPSA
jgi:hypothetical protein